MTSQYEPLTPKSGVGTWERAKQFADAGSLVYANRASRFDQPFVAHFLFGHSIELVLKAFLISEGIKEPELKYLGHDLDRCLDRAKEFQRFQVEISDGDRGLIQLFNFWYKAKEFEYLMVGSADPPYLSNLESACLGLLKQIKPLVEQAALRESAREG